jgi:hypothetical protein
MIFALLLLKVFIVQKVHAILILALHSLAYILKHAQIIFESGVDLISLNLQRILFSLIYVIEAQLKLFASMKYSKGNAIKLFGVLIFFSYITRGLCAPIMRNLPVCRETSKSYDLEAECHDTACVLYKNILYQMSNLDDVFNYIYTADHKQVIVYSNKGRVYETVCEMVSSFDLIPRQNCSKYVAVNFQLKYEQSIGFLTRQNIIRLKINHEDNCQISSEEKEFGNYDKEYKLYKKGDAVAISGRNDSIQFIDFEDQNKILESYDSVFASSLPNLLLDVFLSIVGIIVYAAIFYKIIINLKSIKRCTSVSKKTLHGSKKLCCWCKSIDKKLEPTTQNTKVPVFNPTITYQPTNSFKSQSTADFAQPILPSAPPSLPCSQIYLEGGPNLYQTIGNNLPVSYNSTASLYQARMPTRSCSNIHIKEEPYEDANRGEYDTICPHCPMYPPPKWPKYCKGTVGLALHKSKTHNIK